MITNPRERRRRVLIVLTVTGRVVLLLQRMKDGMTGMIATSITITTSAKEKKKE